MDPRSEGLLAHVHPELARVMRAAAQTPQAFEIVYGLRTLAAEVDAVSSKHSQTLHSRHLAGPDGLSRAVDVVAINDGHVNFAKGHEESVFGQIAKQVEVAALTLNIPLEWGGAPVGAWTPGVVSHFHDWGHFQLPWREFP